MYVIILPNLLNHYIHTQYKKKTQGMNLNKASWYWILQVCRLQQKPSERDQITAKTQKALQLFRFNNELLAR